MTRFRLPQRVGWARARTCAPPPYPPAQAGEGRGGLAGWLCSPCAAAAVLMAVTASFGQAPDPPTDAEILALMKTHCVACHAAEPTHEAFAKAPAGILLETIVQIAGNTAKIMTQVVIDRAMPLGNQTAMTDRERDRIAAWIEGRNK
jgi:uncharacterized membrane protein